MLRTTHKLPGQASSPQASSGQADRANDAKARWLAAALIAAIALVHAWIISAGRFTHWPTRTAYYSLLADGFLQGQTSLPIAPDSRLLASPDPYDPRFNSRLRLQDAALYNGKYYIYWGPLPALLLVPVRMLTRGTGPIGDQYVFFAFTLALLAISAKLVLRARWRFFPEAPWWTIGFGVVFAGLVNPIPFLLANASVYQTAIIGGQFFLLTGIYAAWRALDADVDPKRSVPSLGGCIGTGVPPVFSAQEHRRDAHATNQFPSAPRAVSTAWKLTVRSADPAETPGAWLFVTGACWAMAIGCRISLTPAVVAVSCLLAWRLWRSASNWRETARCLLCLTLPLLAGAGLFAAYNQVRFGSPLEFGARYVLAGQNMHAMVAAGSFASARYIPANLVRYLLEAPVLQRTFPFICPYGTDAWGWFGIHVNKDFIVDSVAGMVWAAPVFGLAAVPVWVGLRRIYSRLGRRDESPAANPTPSSPTTPIPVCSAHVGTTQPPIFWWLVAALLIASALGFLPSLMVAASTMRYLADATPSLAILASLGVWMHLQPATPRHRAARIGALIILTAYSALTGILLGVAGHYGHFVTDSFAGGR